MISLDCILHIFLLNYPVLICQRDFLNKDFIYFYRKGKGGRGGEQRERNIQTQDKHILVASRSPPTGDLSCNPGMCPDWESNQRPFGL